MCVHNHLPFHKHLSVAVTIEAVASLLKHLSVWTFTNVTICSYRLLKRLDFPEAKFSLYFLGYEV